MVEEGEKERLNTIGEDEEDKNFETNKSKGVKGPQMVPQQEPEDDYQEDRYEDDDDGDEEF